MAPTPLINSARVEIDSETLVKLLSAGTLRACELHCLDTSSKQLLQKLCLDSCARHLAKGGKAGG
jgi:hypothetical protein